MELATLCTNLGREINLTDYFWVCWVSWIDWLTDNQLNYVAETGASFIVFIVPATPTSRTHCSIVEDGILVQLPRSHFDALHNALRSGENFFLTESDFADIASGGGEELVIVQWIDDLSHFDLNER